MMIYILSVSLFFTEILNLMSELQIISVTRDMSVFVFYHVLVEIQPPPIMMIYISSGPAFCRDSKFKVRNLQIHRLESTFDTFTFDILLNVRDSKIREGIGLYSQISPLQSYVGHATHMCVSIYRKWKHLSPIFIILIHKRGSCRICLQVVKLSQ